MRIIVLLKSGDYHTCNDQDRFYSENQWVQFITVNGVQVDVPAANVHSIETYGEQQMDLYKSRIRELDKLSKERKA